MTLTAAWQARSAQRDADKHFFMLYLNQETWLGVAGSKLADQVPRRSEEHVLHFGKHNLGKHNPCIPR